MGTHTGPIRVYASTWLRCLEPLLQPSTTFWLWLITGGAMAIGRILIFVNVIATIALATTVVALWVSMWMARSTTRYVLITDRFRWEQVERACDAIVEHLPNASMLSRKEVRSVIQSARWDAARMMRDSSRLTDLQRATSLSMTRLPDDDPLQSELEMRHRLLGEQIQSIHAEIGQRLGRLQSLAMHSIALTSEKAKSRRRRAAAERARRTLARADAGIAEAAIWVTRADPAADFTERAEAILAAYQELSSELLTTSEEGQQTDAFGLHRH